MRKIIIATFGVALLGSMFIAGCAYGQNPNVKNSIAHAFDKAKPEKPHVDKFAAYKVYTPDINAMVEIDKALSQARKHGTKVMVVMGANWCHDSKSFAARMDKPEFKTLIENNYELVYVSAGTDPGQKDQNREVSKRFGVDAIVGTPTIFIATPDGTVLNADSAGYWRHANNIPTDMSYAYLDMYAQK